MWEQEKTYPAKPIKSAMVPTVKSAIKYIPLE